ncbi:hypothetical protein ONE63_000526 [Megalurothrips usitatus]|uniref:Cytochrome b5 heme-binding domain-containing protein n=1 Tax=Megalurothrips usitatus TaxID=439358 RepID=A0AAV7Y3M2_9NEOP|nr:hypothetical protein ONE63_000526 [Megalurothrips usitatus]
MSFKAATVGVLFLAISVTYLHEYHRDKIMILSNITIVKRSLAVIHDFIVKLSSKISLSVHHSNPKDKTDRLFSTEEVAKFNGEEGSPGIYLVILGKVYDVSRGSKHYGPGGSYHAFAGRDASRAFVTGDFSENGTTDDVTGLTPDDLKSIQDWSQFYHNEYTYKGKLIGRYYNSEGDRTDYYNEVERLIKVASEASAAQNADYQKYPPCNAEWTPEAGSRVWCSNRSGGIERDWVGVPRKYYKPGSDSYRCACIQIHGEATHPDSKQKKGNVIEYKDCPPSSESCRVKD